MKIYDCFQFFDEDMMLDLRLNILDKYVHKFVIVENLKQPKTQKSGKPQKKRKPKKSETQNFENLKEIIKRRQSTCDCGKISREACAPDALGR